MCKCDILTNKEVHETYAAILGSASPSSCMLQAIELGNSFQTTVIPNSLPLKYQLSPILFAIASINKGFGTNIASCSYYREFACLLGNFSVLPNVD